jgi:hypothetical protein
MVKMENMVGDVSGSEDEVTDNSAVIGYFIGETEGAIQIKGSGYRVAGRADAADTLDIPLGITGVSAFKD